MSVKQTAPLYPPSSPNTLEKVSREREPVASLRCRECRKLDPSVSTLFFFSSVCVVPVLFERAKDEGCNSIWNDWWLQNVLTYYQQSVGRKFGQGRRRRRQRRLGPGRIRLRVAGRRRSRCCHGDVLGVGAPLGRLAGHALAAALSSHPTAPSPPPSPPPATANQQHGRRPDHSLPHHNSQVQFSLIIFPCNVIIFDIE